MSRNTKHGRESVPPNERTPLIYASPRAAALAASPRTPQSIRSSGPSSPVSWYQSPTRGNLPHAIPQDEVSNGANGTNGTNANAPRRGNLSGLLGHNPRRSSMENGEDEQDNTQRATRTSGSLFQLEDDDDDATDEMENGDGGECGGRHFSYFASPSKILCTASIKGDYMQARAAVDMVVRKVEARARSTLTDPSESVRLYKRNTLLSEAVTRLLVTHEPRHAMNALHLAVLYDHPLIVEFLLVTATKYCVSDTCQSVLDSSCGESKHHATPLMLCASVATASLLIDHGASLEAQNSSGMTALHYAASTGNAGVVSLLITKGADVNETDSRGATALHWAVFEGFQYTAMLLVGHGADQQICDSEKHTALMIASALGDAFLAKQLVVEGAPISVKDKQGRAALDIARQGGHLETVSALKAGASDRFVASLSRKGAAMVFFYCMVLVAEILSLRLAIPSLQDSSYWANVSIAACCVVCALYTYVWLKDPGYVPKSTQPAHELLALESTSVPCPTCVTLKPLRSKHCSSCRRCVYRFDHHCPWINNCIGLGNHRGFLLFLASLVAFCGLVASFSGMILVGRRPLYPAHADATASSSSPSSSTQLSPLVLRFVHSFLVLCALLFGLPTLALLVIQLRNVHSNLTTNEVFNKDKYPYLKTPMDEFQNPYDRGCWRNFEEVCRQRNTEEAFLFGFEDDHDAARRRATLVVDPDDK